jgi:mannose-6-phosphate isomerase-like protein (cupin superfamily)
LAKHRISDNVGPCQALLSARLHALKEERHDEYMMVVQGSYTLVIQGKRIAVKAGEDYFIPRGVPHRGRLRLEPERSTDSEAIGLTGSGF